MFTIDRFFGDWFYFKIICSKGGGPNLAGLFTQITRRRTVWTALAVLSLRTRFSPHIQARSTIAQKDAKFKFYVFQILMVFNFRNNAFFWMDYSPSSQCSVEQSLFRIVQTV